MLSVFAVLLVLLIPFLFVFMCWAARRDRHIGNLNKMLKGWPADSVVSRGDKIKTKARFPNELKNYSIN
jgi:hypothetical protein